MADTTKYNLNNPAIKRIMREIKEMEKENSTLYYAKPMEDNLFEWHFTIRGPSETPFESGIFHGRIILPAEYPFKPPNFMFLTPNGRFEVGKKICLSISAYHPEYWQPGWSIRTALIALIGFMPTKGEGAIGALDYTADERQSLAKKSQSWSCDKCGAIAAILPEENADELKSVQNEFNQVKASADAIAAQKPEEKPKNENPEEVKRPETPTQPVVNNNPAPAPQPVVNNVNNINPPVVAVRRESSSNSTLDILIAAVGFLFLALLIKKYLV